MLKQTEVRIAQNLIEVTSFANPVLTQCCRKKQTPTTCEHQDSDRSPQQNQLRLKIMFQEIYR